MLHLEAEMIGDAWMNKYVFCPQCVVLYDFNTNYYT